MKRIIVDFIEIMMGLAIGAVIIVLLFVIVCDRTAPKKELKVGSMKFTVEMEDKRTFDEKIVDSVDYLIDVKDDIIESIFE